MSKVNLYKNIKDTTSNNIIELDSILQKIQNGYWQTPVEYYRKIRDTYSKGHKQEVETKKQLPYFTVSGVFEKRENDGLLDHSGFVAVDIDPGENPRLNDANEFLEVRQQIINDKYTYSCFASASAKGFCVIMRIEPEEHFDIFDQIEAYYKFNFNIQIDYLADVSRARFVSFDRELFINDDSFPFEFGCEPDCMHLIQSDHSSPQAKVILNTSRPQSDKEVFDFAVQLAESYSQFEDGNKHKFVVQLAKYCNRMGLNKSQTTDFIYERYPRFAQDPSNAIEWEYKNKTSRHGNWTWKKEAPESEYDIYDQYDRYPFMQSFEKKDVEVWFVDKFKFIKWLHTDLGFALTFRNGVPVFIKVRNNIVSQLSREELVSFTMSRLEKDRFVQEKVSNKSGLMSPDALLLLPNVTRSIKPARDPKDKSFFFYKNGYCIVNKNGIGEIKSYDTLDFLIWDVDIIQREVKKSKTFLDGDFAQFMLNICNKDQDRRKKLFTSLGYLLHTYKDRSCAKSIVLVDQNSNFNQAEGGTGKSLLSNAISQMRSIVREDGKMFDRKNVQFLFQNVKESTKVFCLDDVTKYFKWDRLFSVITEGINVERKGKTPFEIPFSESPKLLITTNYMVRDDDSSTRRRFVEVEIFNHYSDKLTPMDEFKKVFFDDWNPSEWDQFYFLMMHCVQVYLRDGLEVFISEDRSKNKFMTITSDEFFEFCERFEVDKEYKMNEEFADFKDMNTQYKVGIKRATFIKWIKEYAKFKKWGYKNRWIDYKRNKKFWFHSTDLPF